MSENNVLIEVKDLYKVFGPTPEKVLPHVREGISKDQLFRETGHTIGLKNINMEIREGEVFVIMGLSGSGKSTLIRHFNRLIEPTSGSLLIEGTDVLSLNAKTLQEFRRRHVSMVFQHFGLMPHMSVLDNVCFGLKAQGVDKNDREARGRQWLRDVGLEGYDTQYPVQLSGGQQQRVGLARALCTDAPVLLMDEAFSALDPLIRSQMQDQMIELQEKLHKTIVFITHDLDEALRIGDRIAILKDGEVVQIGTPREILLEPADDYVESFVQDVNRARALTVETVMKPARDRITATTIGAALEYMKKASVDFAFVESKEGYIGSVLKEELEEAVAADAKVSDPLVPEYISSEASVEESAPIESILTEALQSPHPLPVVDDTGNLEGVISRNKLAQLFQAPDEEKPDRA